MNRILTIVAVLLSALALRAAPAVGEVAVYSAANQLQPTNALAVVGGTNTSVKGGVLGNYGVFSNLTASLPVETDAAKKLVSGTQTGTGAYVKQTSPTINNPVLGGIVTATNITGSGSEPTSIENVNGITLDGDVDVTGDLTGGGTNVWGELAAKATTAAVALKANLSGGNTLGGAQTLAEGGSITLDAAGSADGAWSGIARAGTAGAALAFGDLIVLDVTDSRWELADANAASGADGDARGMIGICVLAATGDGDPTVVLLHGVVRADAAFPSLTVNGPVYVSETAGDVTSTSPTTEDNVVRILGAAWTADEIYFVPDRTWVAYDAP